MLQVKKLDVKRNFDQDPAVTSEQDHIDRFLSEHDLPGVDPQSIDLTVEKNVLTVHAQRRRAEVDEVEMLVGERPQGTFSRQLFLGETLDAERIEATYSEGVLQLRLPIAEKAKPRRVPIKTDGAQSVIEATSDAHEPAHA
jgi:HSP20 family protein